MFSLKFQKIILSIIILAGLGLVFYNTFLGQTETPVSTEGVEVPQSVGQDILVLFDKLNNVNVDKSIFASSLFQSLVDTSSEISPETVGRDNPFLMTSGMISTRSSSKR